MPVSRVAREANQMRPTSKLIQMEQIFRKMLESLWRGKVERNRTQSTSAGHTSAKSIPRKNHPIKPTFIAD